MAMGFARRISCLRSCRESLRSLLSLGHRGAGIFALAAPGTRIQTCPPILVFARWSYSCFIFPLFESLFNFWDFGVSILGTAKVPFDVWTHRRSFKPLPHLLWPERLGIYFANIRDCILRAWILALQKYSQARLSADSALSAVSFGDRTIRHIGL